MMSTSPQQLPTTPIDQLTYEQAFNQLETIVAALETETYTLEETLALFERGQALSQHCTSLLDQAELRVQQIVGEELVNLSPES